MHINQTKEIFTALKKEEETLREKIKSYLEPIAKEIDDKFKNENKSLTTSELEYVELTSKSLARAIYKPEYLKTEKECRWLGDRRELLQKTVIEKSEDTQIKEEILTKIEQHLDNYKIELIARYQLMIKNRKNTNTFYHGSIDCAITKFTPRDQTTSGSKGDIVPLVYATYDKNFALSFIVEKELSYSSNYKNAKVLYKTTIENLILNYDIGGILYEFLGEQANNFRIDMAKDKSEVVCHEPVEPTKKTEVISTLNELLQSDFAVFYNNENKNPKRLTKEILLSIREKCIQNLIERGEEITGEEKEKLQDIIDK